MIQQTLANIDYSLPEEDVLLKIKPLKHSFLAFALTMFEAVTPIAGDNGYSLKATMDAMPSTVTNINGVFMQATNLKHLIMFIHNTNRSKLIMSSMTKEPRLGSLTPLFLYAQKTKYGIKYMEWDKSDVTLEFALGKTLAPLAGAIPQEYKDYYNLSPQEIAEIRAVACPEGLIKYKCRWPVKSPFKYMILQSWICHASIRDPESMILDYLDWDNVPETLDQEYDPGTVVVPMTTNLQRNSLPW
jgi:hypothetical protein